MSVAFTLLSQVAGVRRADGPILAERLAAAVIVAIVMVPGLYVRANAMFLLVVAVFVGALVAERRSGRLSQPAH